MVRSIVSKVMWVGRATVFMVGLAVILAVAFGVASAAFGANGDNFILGQTNVATLTTRLAGPNGVNAGPMLEVQNSNADSNDWALSLKVDRNEPPLTVNSSAKVPSLNADLLDGQDASQIGGATGWSVAQRTGVSNSESSKTVEAFCPSGRRLVGTGFDVAGGKSGSFPNEEVDVVVDQVIPFTSSVSVQAYEDEPTNANWSVKAIAICATVDF
jgi:hypothetical protein